MSSISYFWAAAFGVNVESFETLFRVLLRASFFSQGLYHKFMSKLACYIPFRTTIQTNRTRRAKIKRERENFALKWSTEYEDRPIQRVHCVRFLCVHWFVSFPCIPAHSSLCLLFICFVGVVLLASPCSARFTPTNIR